MPNISESLTELIDDLDKRDDVSDEEMDLIDDIVASFKSKKSTEDRKELLRKFDDLIVAIKEKDSLGKEAEESIVKAIKEIKIAVTVPPIPPIKVPPVKIPPIKVPTIRIPPTVVKFPENFSIKKPSWLPAPIDLSKILNKLTLINKLKFTLPKRAKDAIPVRLSDGEKFYKAIGGAISSAVGALPFKRADSSAHRALVDNDGHVQVDVLSTGLQTPTDFTGAPVTVGTTAIKITFTGVTRSIFLQSDHNNTSSNIWVGKSNVTNAGANAMARLGQGESLTIELDDASNAIYVVSDTASQTLFKMAVL